MESAHATAPTDPVVKPPPPTLTSRATVVLGQHPRLLVLGGAGLAFVMLLAISTALAVTGPSGVRPPESEFGTLKRSSASPPRPPTPVSQVPSSEPAAVPVTDAPVTPAPVTDAPVTPAPVTAIGKPFCFMSHGCWGGGTRQKYQLPVAALMEQMAEAYTPRFVIAAGDNFYKRGVKTSSDPQIEQVFEKPYNGTHLRRAPFLVNLGNHDYKGNIWAQVNYTNISSRTPPSAEHPTGEPRWYLPHPYYERRYPEASLVIIMVDVMLLEYCDMKGLKHWRCWDGGKHRAWIDERLKAAKTDGIKWVVVSGHFPLHANGPHKNYPWMQRDVELPIWRHGATMYINAHNHYQQMSLVPPEAAPSAVAAEAAGKSPILFVNSGGGGGLVTHKQNDPDYKLSPHNVFIDFYYGATLHCIRETPDGDTMTTQFFSVKTGAAKPIHTQVQTRKL